LEAVVVDCLFKDLPVWQVSANEWHLELLRSSFVWELWWLLIKGSCVSVFESLCFKASSFGLSHSMPIPLTFRLLPIG